MDYENISLYMYYSVDCTQHFIHACIFMRSLKFSALVVTTYLSYTNVFLLKPLLLLTTSAFSVVFSDKPGISSLTHSLVIRLLVRSRISKVMLEVKAKLNARHPSSPKPFHDRFNRFNEVFS